MTSEYQQLLSEIQILLKNGRKQSTKQINQILIHTYWQIGRCIVLFEQQGKKRAKYGKALITKISNDLSKHFDKGFSRRNVSNMRNFYLAYPIWQTLSAKLSWSHYIELLSISDDMARSFYAKQCLIDRWSVRELKRQRNSALFERLALSKNKKEVLRLAKEGQQIKQANDVLKDPYVFEFLNFENKEVILERDLEHELVDKLGHFLLELGKGFAFIGKQYRITIDNQHFYVDLVFYHRILKCFVLLDLKTGKVNHQDIGQMNMYLNYFRLEENVEGDAAPIGIVLAADKSEMLVKYATAGIDNQLFVSKYQLHLPNKSELQAKLLALLEEQV